MILYIYGTHFPPTALPSIATTGKIMDEPIGRCTGLVSPCISVCEIDETSGFCKGCQRTRAEIRGWSRGNRLDQLKIIDALRERRLRLGLRPRRSTKRRKVLGL